MTFADQVAFYRDVAKVYPVQESSNVGMASAVFDFINGEDLEVIELGGWNGRLASQLVTRPDIRSWVNYDLVVVPQACENPRYNLSVLTDWIWNTEIPRADVFVACHTIEHLSAEHFYELAKSLREPWVYFEAPLDEEPTDWNGYAGSHRLDLGWAGVRNLMEMCGYEPAAGLTPVEKTAKAAYLFEHSIRSSA